MAGIIKAGTPLSERPAVGTVAFNFDDVTSKANAYLQQVKAEAAQIIAQAQQEAAQIRKQAQEQGNKTALETAEKSVQARLDALVKQQMQSALPAVQQMVALLQAERLQWLEKWEQNAVRLAIAIAEKVVRRELAQQPEITLGLVREALELASGSHTITVYLHPEDHAALGKQVASLAHQIAQVAPANIVADAGVMRGGCVVQTEYGTIDQQLESQLARITEELF